MKWFIYGVVTLVVIMGVVLIAYSVASRKRPVTTLPGNAKLCVQ